MLIADDAALPSHKEGGLHRAVIHVPPPSPITHACREFGLTLSLMKTNVYSLAVVEKLTYLGSTLSSSFFVDAETNGRIVKVVAVMARLNQRVWNNPNLTL